MGIAILGSIGVAIYRGQLATSLPAGIPGQAAAAARDTLGGAVAVAQQLPAEVGTALLGAARAAFTTGLQVTAGISAVIAVGIAVAATVLLRAVRSSSETAPTPAAAPAPAVAAPAPAVAAKPQEPVQVIRTGGGCFACPPGDRSSPAA